MIVYELICAGEHRFEGWFASGEVFERQRDSGLLACPVCASAAVERLPSARIRRGAQAGAPPPSAAPEPTGVAKQKTVSLASFVDQILQNTENVGARFPDEARKIHYEEAPRRGIRGTASRDDAEALAAEGIAVFPLPVPPPEEWQ
jgi:hypothetical protein